MPTAIIYNEKELLTLVAEGDATAFRSIFDHYRNKVFSIAYRLTKTEPAAEDVVQDVFIKLWINREKLGQLGNFNAYLNTITRNHIFNQLRRLATEEAFLQGLVATKAAAHSLDTSQTIAYHELKKALDQAIARLSPQQKKVYQLGKIEGMKYEEIAAVLQISRETVKNHMVEALRSIKTYLTEREEFLILAILVLLGNSSMQYFS